MSTISICMDPFGPMLTHLDPIYTKCDKFWRKNSILNPYDSSRTISTLVEQFRTMLTFLTNIDKLAYPIFFGIYWPILTYLVQSLPILIHVDQYIQILSNVNWFFPNVYPFWPLFTHSDQLWSIYPVWPILTMLRVLIYFKQFQTILTRFDQF